MSGEPLWRGPLGAIFYAIEEALRGRHPIDGELEVWRAGDRPEPVECETCGGSGWQGEDPDNPERCASCRGGGDRPVPPTRDDVHEVLAAWFGGGWDASNVEPACDELMALLSGVPTEPEEPS